MPQHHLPTCSSLLYLALLLVCGGCSTNPPTSNTYLREWRSAGIEPHGMRLVLTESELDIENLHPATVLIKVMFEGGGSRTCSGVIIDSRLALTAAHCVCGFSRSGQRVDKNKTRSAVSTGAGTVVMDSSTCVASATVTTVVYKNPTKMDSDHRGHIGKVRPHQKFRIVLDQQGNVLVNEADLAIITLNDPLNVEEFQPASLAQNELRLRDIVTLVGFGYDNRTDGHSGERRSGQNTVAALEISGKTFLVGQKGSHTLGGDSGGPCFRGGMLVGIATTTSSPPVEFSEFTSTWFYRDWLNSEIESVRKTRPATTSGAP